MYISAASAINSGNQVYWASENRSDKTRLRAEKYGLRDASSLLQPTQNSEIIFSVCPPHSAEDVAKSVIDNGFKGYYLDANAIAPQRALKIGNMMASNGIHFIDGGIIGGPAWNPKETWLYLSGKDAKVIAGCFSNGPLETKIIGDDIGKASALNARNSINNGIWTIRVSQSWSTAERLASPPKDTRLDIDHRAVRHADRKIDTADLAALIISEQINIYQARQVLRNDVCRRSLKLGGYIDLSFVPTDDGYSSGAIH